MHQKQSQNPNNRISQNHVRHPTAWQFPLHNDFSSIQIQNHHINQQQRNQNKLGGIELHPNPINQGMQLNITAKESLDMNIRVLSVEGKLMLKTKASGTDVVVPTEQLVPGVYLLQVTAGSKGTFQSKFIVK